jgi:Ycf66 protein N-terminus
MLSPTFSSVLAIVVALASLFLFLISFIAPRLYRAQDLWWSGVGVFYALVLWFCSAQIRGALLLGTIASVSLLGWLSTQVYLNRWAALTDAEKGTGTLKQLQALGRQLNRLLESRPAPKPTPLDTAEPTPSPSGAEVPAPTGAAKAAKGPKTGKVRWVRPEKPKAPTATEALVQPPVETQPDAPPIADVPGAFSAAISDTGAASAPSAVEPSEPIAQAGVESTPQEQPAVETIVSPSVESAPPPETTDEWDDMEADLEDDFAAEAPSKPPVLNRSEAAPSIPETPKTGVVKRIQNFFQGRKNHGKRFVRPDDEPVSTKPTPRLEPSAPSSVETSPPELSDLAATAAAAIEPVPLASETIEMATIAPVAEVSEPTEEPLPVSPTSEDRIAEAPVAEDQTHEETDEKVALEVTPEDTTADLQPEDLASEDLASEDLASQEIASENVLPEDETKLAPEDVTPEDETPENVAPESPEAIDNTNPVSVESPVEPAEAPVKNPAPSAETLDS